MFVEAEADHCVRVAGKPQKAVEGGGVASPADRQNDKTQPALRPDQIHNLISAHAPDAGDVAVWRDGDAARGILRRGASIDRLGLHGGVRLAAAEIDDQRLHGRILDPVEQPLHPGQALNDLQQIALSLVLQIGFDARPQQQRRARDENRSEQRHQKGHDQRLGYAVVRRRGHAVVP